MLFIPQGLILNSAWLGQTSFLSAGARQCLSPHGLLLFAVKPGIPLAALGSARFPLVEYVLLGNVASNDRAIRLEI
jgi:hypothetical protein